MRTRLVIAALSALAIAACSKDSTTGTGETGTTTPPVYTLSLDSGIVDSISAPVGSVVPVRVHLKKAGVGVPATTVTWTVSAGHGSVSSGTTTSDASGGTSVNWTLGDTAGVNALGITALDASLGYRAVGVAGAATTLAKISADSATVVAGASAILTVRVTDRGGNPVSGATVTWTTSAGTLTTTTTTTGSSGNAQTVLTTSARGSYTVTAVLAGKATVTFKVGAI